MKFDEPQPNNIHADVYSYNSEEQSNSSNSSLERDQFVQNN